MRLILALVGVALVVLAAVTWLNRRNLAREALTGWLKSRGIAARAEVEEFGPSTFIARISIGDPNRPDFSAERAEVRYRPRVGGVDVLSVTLRKPLLRASYHDGRFAMGALDPLVQEFLRQPPRPDAAKPRVRVDDGVLVLSTDYGPVRLGADALVDNGQLQSLAATSEPARLRGPQFDVSVGRAVVAASRLSGQIQARLDAPLATARFAGGQAREARLQVHAVGPYPDLVQRRGEGPLTIGAQLTSRRASLGGRGFESVDIRAAFVGQTRGWIQDLAVGGRATLDLRAAGGEFDGARVGVLRAAAASEDLRFTRKGGDRIAGTVRVNGTAERLAAQDLRIATLTATAAGPVDVSAAGYQADLRGSTVGRGGWTGLGPPAAADTADMAAIKRAARSFRFAAPALALRVKDGEASVGLPQPVRLTADSGGTVTLAGRGATPVFGPDGGAFRLTVAGGGLPALDADVSRLTLTEDGATAAGRLRARGSVALLHGGDVDASGRLTVANGGLVFAADRCVRLKAERLEFGANDVEALSGQLCPVEGPLFTMRGQAWRVAGHAREMTASAPFIQGRVEGGAGRVTAQGRGEDVTARIHVDTARQEDTAPEPRFNPFLMTGDLTLSEYIWRADLDFLRPGGAPLGNAKVTHDGRLGLGVVVMETETLTFAEGGLQPADISPMASAVGSPAVGQARFTGRFDWAPEGSTSSGKLTIPGLDFQSPAGAVKGLKGEIAFSSLAPLKAAPGQELEVAEVQSMVLLTGLRARFELAENLLKVEGGEAGVGGGRIRAETLEIPLTPDGATRGILHVDGVQLHDLVEASPFGDKVELDAKVSGKIPFEAQGSRVRISGGVLTADQPGRLSIDRTALTGVSADAPAETPATPDPNATITDFAYQAMENLAFDTLAVTVSSREDGRLGMMFQIVGRHDPPQKQRIRLTLMDLIQQRFLGRTLPLPSNTGVNLTLDTTLNLDDLLGDWAEFQRVKSSGPVQK